MTMQCNLTEPILAKILVGNKNVAPWFEQISSVLPEYGIVSKLEVSAFLAQTAIESGYFNRTQENLNYNESGLANTFRSHFSPSELSKYAHHPEMIANRVYANRYGNGDEASGDGWKYCGKGLIQVTFRANYSDYSHWAYQDDRAVENPAILSQPTDAIKSAVWFWKHHNLGVLAENKDMKTITQKINGGLNGLQDRMNVYNKITNLI